VSCAALNLDLTLPRHTWARGEEEVAEERIGGGGPPCGAWAASIELNWRIPPARRVETARGAEERARCRRGGEERREERKARGRERERERERERRVKAPRSSSAHPSSRSRASPPVPFSPSGENDSADSLSCILRIHRIIIMITTIMTTIIISPGRFGSAALTAGVGSPPLSPGTSQREGAARVSASAGLARR